MVTNINTVAFSGIEVIPVECQTSLARGTVCFMIVGLGDKAVSESKERITAALNAVGLGLPPLRITINLAPADIQKEGSHYDLAIIAGILVSMGSLPEDSLRRYVILGEISLDGTISKVSGALPSAVYASQRDLGIICPRENGGEVTFAGDQIDIIAPDNLLELINHFKGTQMISRPKNIDLVYESDAPDMSDIKGQETAKRAMEVAASGGHNILLKGPPGTGKSMLAHAMAGIMPPLDFKEILEISMIASVSGNISSGKLCTKRPFRSPHHSCSQAAMTGGGRIVKPGEISLAHKGVLFLDELPEFPRQVLETLRQPMENGNITISRANHHATYPADFQMVAAMNPCRCGYLGDQKRECNRAPECGKFYTSKISGPILDRIDMHIEVPKIDIFDVKNTRQSEGSEKIRSRIIRVRAIQYERYKSYKFSINSRANGAALYETAN